MKIPTQKRIYKDVDNAMVSGVCAGLARYFEVDSIWTRAGAIAVLFFMPVAALVAYFAAVILLPRLP